MTTPSPRAAVLALLLCAGAAAAAAPTKAAPPPAAPTKAAAAPAPREVFLTLGDDAAPAVQDALGRSGRGRGRVLDSRKGITVLAVREDHVPFVSRVMHERFVRCPGFVQHASLDEALVDAHDPAAQLAMSSALVSYTLDNATVVNTLIAQLKASNIVSTITTLAGNSTRYYTSSGGTNAANQLRAQWAGYASGRSDVSVQLYTHAGWSQPSVIATITGTTLPGEVVVIGGHLDSINQSGSVAPGADDDASGIASLTEAFRAAMVTGYRPARTLKFMAYAAEEVGLRGSKEIATAHKNAGANVVGVLQLDMTNYKGSAVDIGLMTDYTNAAQNTFVSKLIDAYTGATWQNSSCGYGCSDHASWTAAGYPASMPFEALMGGSNPRIHTANDTLANSDATGAHALKFSKLAAAFMGELAKGGMSGTPPPPPPPDGTTTETLTGSVATGAKAYHGPFGVKAGTTFEVVMSGTGDPDLYVQWGAQPTTSSYACRPYKSGAAETCTLTVPSGQSSAYVMVNGYAAGSYTLKVTYTPGGSTPPPPPPPGETTESFASQSVAAGTFKFYGPFAVKPGTTFKAAASGGTGDADLYVQWNTQPTTGSYACRPYLSGNAETCTLTVPSTATSAHVGLRGYTAASGVGLTVTYTRP